MAVNLLEPRANWFTVQFEGKRIRSCGSGSLVGIATGYGLDVRGLNPGGGEIFRTFPDRAGAHPASCTTGTGSFPGVNSDGDVTLTPHPLL